MKEKKKVKLTKKAEKLLRQAIGEWKEILDGECCFWVMGCILCDEYLVEDASDLVCCKRCPVFLYTGKPLCVDTPDSRHYKSTKTKARAVVNYGNKILMAGGKKPI